MKKHISLLIVLILLAIPLLSQNMDFERSSYNSYNRDLQENTVDRDSSLTKEYVQCAQLDILDVGYHIGVGSNKKNRFFLNAFWGYKIRPYFILGYGWAMHYYYDEEAVLIPFMTEFRFDIPDKRALPFLAIRVGHSLEITNSKYFKDTGFLLNFSLGYNLHISNDIHINMEAGYAYQEADIFKDSSLHNDLGLQAISLSVGIILW